MTVIRAAELLAMEIPPQHWIIPNMLPAGLTLFVGRGKDGKSLMAWNICMAIASGGKALGAYDVEPGAVLYLALEDGQRRAKARLQAQMRHAQLDEAPPRLDLVLWNAPRIGEGLEPQISDWLDTHPDARLVIVDILEKVRPPRQRNGSIYVKTTRP
jgi:AAA domain